MTETVCPEGHDIDTRFPSQASALVDADGGTHRYFVLKYLYVPPQGSPNLEFDALGEQVDLPLHSAAILSKTPLALHVSV
jgi:hypothetical protein